MKKRIITWILTAALALSLLPLSCFAAEEPRALPTRMTGQITLPEAAPEADPAMLYDRISRPVLAAMEPLSAARATDPREALLYERLSAAVEDIAAGKTDDAAVTLEDEGGLFTLTRAELGITGPSAAAEDTAEGWLWSLTEDAAEAAGVWLSAALNRIYDRLVVRHPYELYWHDKSMSGGMGFVFLVLPEEYAEQTDIVVYTVQVIFAVSERYQDPEDPGLISGEMVERAKYAAAEAQNVVAANAGLGVYDRLVAYREYICNEVSYDSLAADPYQPVPYGDPWQPVSVFDRDSRSNVVCEGYAKAFQYLCDLTWTEDDPAVQCRLVSGVMSGGTGEGSHMWNVVTLGARNYLVDVTNCDSGTVGVGDGLFLRGARGSVARGYTVTVDSGNNRTSDIVYVYSPDIVALYEEGELAISDTDFDPVTYEDPLEPGTEIVGDLHRDGRLDAADMQALYECLNGEKILTDDYAGAVADVNGDGTVNILDYQALYQIVKKSK